jgi:hypothetical protein
MRHGPKEIDEQGAFLRMDLFQCMFSFLNHISDNGDSFLKIGSGLLAISNFLSNRRKLLVSMRRVAG